MSGVCCWLSWLIMVGKGVWNELAIITLTGSCVIMFGAIIRILVKFDVVKWMGWTTSSCGSSLGKCLVLGFDVMMGGDCAGVFT